MRNFKISHMWGRVVWVALILIKTSSLRHDKMLFGEKHFKPKEETL
jgi:hypothetical protein